MIKHLAKYLFIVSLLISFSNTQSDIFSSITTLQDAFQTEKIMFNNLERFIKESELNIIGLKKFINNHESAFENSNLLNPEMMSDNPLKKLIALQKFLKKSGVIEFLLSQTPETDLRNFTRFQFINTYPTDEDLEGILRGIARIQKVYLLSPHDIVKDDKVFSPDLFQIGYGMYQLNEGKFASEWFAESLNQFELEEHNLNSSIDGIKILDYLFTSKWTEDGSTNSIQAINLANKIFHINPENNDLKENIESFKTPHVTAEKKNLTDVEKERYLYNLACRGELQKSAKEVSELQCGYLTKNHPFLKLARVKYEELNKSPLVFLFHDLISDNEIEILKVLVRRNLKESRVWDIDTGKDKKSEIRVGKNAWLDLFDNDIVPIIRQRVEDVTNLVARFNSFEKLQIGNYGIGGQYEPHFDNFIESPDETIEKFGYYEAGNRIATLMFYLSDVEKGGATVFPLMKLSIRPQKGTAVFWHNLHASGAADSRTMHAGCPVIKGSKWVANHWIREREQIFKRPCELMDDSKI